MHFTLLHLPKPQAPRTLYDCVGVLGCGSREPKPVRDPGNNCEKPLLSGGSGGEPGVIRGGARVARFVNTEAAANLKATTTRRQCCKGWSSFCLIACRLRRPPSSMREGLGSVCEQAHDGSA